MEITIIGSGTSVPSINRASPCLLLTTHNFRILCDTGPGSLRQLLHAGVTLHDIDLIIYTHFHIDHTADFAPFLFAGKYAPEKPRTNNLSIIGPRGMKKFYTDLVHVYGSWIVPEHFTLDLIELVDDQLLLDAVSIKAAPVVHSENSIAVRIENRMGKAAVYSGDTDYCEQIVRLAQKADVLILECAFPEHMKATGHLIPSLAGRIAREAQCKKLVLTHFYPACDAHDLLTPLRTEFTGDTLLAEDLMKIHL